MKCYSIIYNALAIVKKPINRTEITRARNRAGLICWGSVVNVLSADRQAAAIAALCEGVSIRATERLTGINRNTIMRLGVKVGEGCEVLHNSVMTNLTINRLEFDELWGFVKKKRKRVTEADPDTVGDQYTFMAMDAVGKAIIAWRIGKRNSRNTIDFVADVRRRVRNNPDISTDGFPAYLNAIEEVFQGQSQYGIVDKQEVIVAKGPDAKKYYAKQVLSQVVRTGIVGMPSVISTAFIERQNLTFRMSQRRMTRESNGFSKKFENHCAATALYVFHYNFCRVHETLRITPAMHLGLTDHIWSISEMVEAALTGVIATPVKRTTALTLIQGGRV
jgi:IS1 family transposase